MSDEWMIGYCTNVHAGTDLAQIRSNLQRISVPVLEALGRERMGVGLWIPAEAAGELVEGNQADALALWLAENRLVPFTINGFPFGNFHQPVVKHRVYDPPWWEPSRRDYTISLGQILHRILPDDQIGSISTLPLGWGTPKRSEQQLAAAADNLKQVAESLRRIEDESGRRITLAIEPEPGCVIDMTSDMIAFFEAYIPDERDRRYLTVCHDICHAAVMYENQDEVLRQYSDAGIGIGKVQVSSAITVPWHLMQDDAKREAVHQLLEFAEDRYLHQTSVMDSDGDCQLAEDLPLLLNSDGNGSAVLPMDHSWCIHFHVPIYLERFGQLLATRDAVTECLAALQSTEGLDFTGHLEAETYAWGVLPQELAVDNLSDGIAEELNWLYQQVE